MALALYTTLTISCDPSEEYSGPTIIHSTGVQAYRVAPEVIRILQETFTNDRLCDHERGVQCFDPVSSVIQAFENAGFEVASNHETDDLKIFQPSRNAYEEANRYTVILLRVPTDILAIETCLHNRISVPIDIILECGYG
ncbi:hypothetical protein I4U23_004776 [Adineta vaga]|nr:hypothetical protein I4U23_004776 [Adineta vaga]